MPKELWSKVCNIVQEVVTKTILQRKKCKKANKKGKDIPGAEFQSIARRDKKAFLSEQCKEIEENNRMGKTRELFKKIGDPKGTFLAKMGTIRDRTSKDLTEIEEI